MKNQVSLERLRELLHYDPDSGSFRWIKKPFKGPVSAGDVAGSIHPHGYRTIKIDQVYYREHRLAWFYVYGDWPLSLLDHINGCKSDNRICNLREANLSENAANSKIKSNNTSGYRGVHWSKTKNKWHAKIRVNGKRLFLGQFDSPEDASAVYETFAKTAHGVFYVGHKKVA